MIPKFRMPVKEVVWFSDSFSESYRSDDAHDFIIIYFELYEPGDDRFPCNMSIRCPKKKALAWILDNVPVGMVYCVIDREKKIRLAEYLEELGGKKN